ncbi:MAG: Bifunctional phosphoglucose/phosphomannose isomerase [Candidatus Bathyarchaeota archaeon BA2]|nr:MAG: Bifunctional phosphoglucose/phosphomannose isomerase [Candidatus Bathyarchaeota archaeon BA2]
MVTLLDQPEKVKKIDKSDMLSHLMKTPDYCRDAVNRARQIRVPEEVKPKNIIIAGMGGSAIGGEILQDWLREEFPIPVEVCKDYVLPAYANEDTLFFVNSYSGNTEETLSAFVEAIRRKCMVIAITSGGHLLLFSKKLQVPHITIPSQLPSRVAIPYLFFPLPALMERMGILSSREKDIEETIRVLKRVGEENSPEIPTEDNTAKKLALELVETIPVIYGFRQYQAIARRLKTQFNENSKVPSKHDVFPELNHNETVGWEASEALTKNYSVILIRDPNESTEIRNRIEATKSLALHKAKKVMEIHASGKGKLAKMFSVLRIGDFISVYLAILQNVDPTPVKIIDKIKMEMKKRFDMTKKLQAEISKMT